MSQLLEWQEAERERMLDALEPLCDAATALAESNALTTEKALKLLESAWRAGKRDAHNAPTIPASATGYRLPGGDPDVVPEPRRRR